MCNIFRLFAKHTKKKPNTKPISNGFNQRKFKSQTNSNEAQIMRKQFSNCKFTGYIQYFFSFFSFSNRKLVDIVHSETE